MHKYNTKCNNWNSCRRHDVGCNNLELTARSWMGTAIMRKFGLNSTGFPADVSALFAMSAFFVLLFVHHSRICTYELAINSGNSFESGNDNKVLLLLLVLGLGL